ncbi:glutaminyl-peptide cyclotransferase [Cellvibrio sp.]|uniref:glutaminyl-peptide cyclotransferase n=1 Tax=Cellvibrio sp. TaxID=1965322 RepID=UPI0039648737
MSDSLGKLETMKDIIRLFCLSLTLIANFSAAQADSLAKATQIPYSIIAERSHKTNLFTQGFLFKDGSFFESSGLYSKSNIVSYPLAEPASAWEKMTAPFSQKQKLPDRFFAEGLTLLNDKLYLVTWQEGTAFVYKAADFSFVKTFNYTGQGWGLATDGKYIIRSDGSQTLFFHNPDTFAVEKTISVKYKQEAILNLNELEYAEGFIWANIWHDNRIIKINPTTGDVVGALDMSDLAKNLKVKDEESVLNGIAYDAEKKAFWITGKQWPKMFLIKMTH